MAIMHRALERAVKAEIITRNAAHAVPPPKVEAAEVEALTAEQIGEVLNKLAGRRLYPIVVLALGTGMRRGELLALRWSDLDLDAGTVRIERSLEETKAGLRFKGPKTRNGRRTISLPSSVIEPLRAHRKAQLEQRVALGLGSLTLKRWSSVCQMGRLCRPTNLSRDWRDVVKSQKLPQVMFHALRHTHASALIAKRLDILTISRRLGHGSPAVTLNVYGHLFQKTDEAAAMAIDEALRSEPVI